MIACAVMLALDARAQDTSPHQSRFVVVAKGVQLEVLDWGGTGRPVVLLAGFGGTAHDFDAFANQGFTHDLCAGELACGVRLKHGRPLHMLAPEQPIPSRAQSIT